MIWAGGAAGDCPRAVLANEKQSRALDVRTPCRYAPVDALSRAAARTIRRQMHVAERLVFGDFTAHVRTKPVRQLDVHRSADQFHLGQHPLAIEKLVDLPSQLSVGDSIPPLVDPSTCGEWPELVEHLRREPLLDLEAGQAGTLLDRPQELDGALRPHAANSLLQPLAGQIPLLDLERTFGAVEGRKPG